eukprot:3341885-Heterocapsa_arctica.AAC.1
MDSRPPALEQEGPTERTTGGEDDDDQGGKHAGERRDTRKTTKAQQRSPQGASPTHGHTKALMEVGYPGAS